MIGNLTILRDENNYGQRLQTYALQRYVEMAFGQKVTTLDRERGVVNLDDGRYFHRFEKECLNLMAPGGRGLEALSDCSKIIVGGDQVFNERWSRGWDEYILRRRKVIRNVFFYGAGLNDKHVISGARLRALAPHVIAYGTREDASGFEDYTKVIDPVFLLRDKWKDMATGRYTPGGVLTYRFRRPTALSLVCPDGSKAVYPFAFAKTPVGIPDPREFVGLFAGADHVITDSFHGFSFALLFRVPHITVGIPDDHRIRNLVRILGVRMEGNAVANYDEISENIERWCARSHEFLERCLSCAPKDYCAHSRDKSLHARSTSGGVCAEAAKAILSKGGVVYGGAFAPDFRKVVTTKVTSMEEYFSRLSKSKYSFCFMPKLDEVKSAIQSGRPMMFIGSPCHIRAIRKFVGDVPESCVLCDFRCRGYSRPDKLARFVDKMEAEHGPVTGLDFRYEHRQNEIRVSFCDTSITCKKTQGFYMDRLPMCRTCRLAHGLISYADITVGDFWRNSGDCLHLGQEFAPENGCNIVSVNTPKGQRLFDEIKSGLAFRPLFSV